MASLLAPQAKIEVKYSMKEDKLVQDFVECVPLLGNMMKKVNKNRKKAALVTFSEKEREWEREGKWVKVVE